MKKIVVLSGAGISAESGISTFRDAGGLWEGYDINEVASIEGWYQDQRKVLNFYNMRRESVALAEPNYAHIRLAELSNEFDVEIITQNVDDLHERAGSDKVLHLHGEIVKAKCMECEKSSVGIGFNPINLGDLCPKGHQLRPDIVWFGEQVPNMNEAAEKVQGADVLLVIGTSLEVYPAAGLVHYSKEAIDLIDPNSAMASKFGRDVNHYQATAVEGIDKWIADIKKGPAKTGPFT